MRGSISLGILLVGCVERFVLEEGSPPKIERSSGGVWVLTTLSPEIWFISDTAVRVGFANLWANDLLLVGDTLFVLNSGTNDVYVYYLSSGYVDTLYVGPGRNPYKMAYSPVHKTLYITNWLTNTVSVFKGGVLIDEVPTLNEPQGILAVGNKLYVSCTDYSGGYENSAVLVYELPSLKVLDTFKFGKNLQALVLDPEGDVYVLSTGDYSGIETTLWKLSEKPDSFFIGGYLGEMCVSQEGFLFLVGWYGGVVAFDWTSDTLIGVVRSDIQASACTLKGDTLVVLDFGGDRVLYLNYTGEILKSFRVGDGPIDVVLQP